MTQTEKKTSEQQFAESWNCFRDRIIHRRIIHAIVAAYTPAGSPDHNCIPCNFLAVVEQIESLLNVLSRNEEIFTLQHAVSLYMHELNLLWERICDIFEITSVPESYKCRHFQTFIQVRRWSNFFKHPREFGLLVHHPMYCCENTDHCDEFRAEEANGRLLFTDTEVRKFYSLDRKKGLATFFRGKETRVAVVFPDIAVLTTGIVREIDKFVDVVSNNPVYVETLNDKSTIEDYFNMERNK